MTGGMSLHSPSDTSDTLYINHFNTSVHTVQQTSVHHIFDRPYTNRQRNAATTTAKRQREGRESYYNHTTQTSSEDSQEDITPALHPSHAIIESSQQSLHSNRSTFSSWYHEKQSKHHRNAGAAPTLQFLPGLETDEDRTSIR